MAKDPAFLFYAADFLVGTITMSNDEVGQYIRLLCLQHQSGHFDAMAMQRLCGGNAAASVLGKFSQDESGLFFNERLDKEIVRRKEHSEKQKQNASMRWHKNGNATAMPLETETITENETSIKAKTEKKGIEISKKIVVPMDWDRVEFDRLFGEWVAKRKKKGKTTSADLQEIRVKELIGRYPKWDDARNRMIEAVNEAWLKFVYPDDRAKSNGSPKQSDHDPRHSSTFKFDKA